MRWRLCRRVETHKLLGHAIDALPGDGFALVGPDGLKQFHTQVPELVDVLSEGDFHVEQKVPRGAAFPQGVAYGDQHLLGHPSFEQAGQRGPIALAVSHGSARSAARPNATLQDGVERLKYVDASTILHSGRKLLWDNFPRIYHKHSVSGVAIPSTRTDKDAAKISQQGMSTEPTPSTPASEQALQAIAAVLDPLAWLRLSMR